MKWSLLILAAFINFSCAYHFGAIKKSLPGCYNKVSVPVFKNKTQETGIENFFTRAMIEELERNRFADVTNEDEAQVILEGTITDLKYERGAYFSATDNLGVTLPDQTALSKEYYIDVTTELKLVRKADHKVLWSSTYDGQKQYPAPRITTKGLNSANALYNHSARLQNIAAIAKEMMAQAHNHMTENF
jgi:curli biogenesis system outer membrane secretion channel CsgG